MNTKFLLSPAYLCSAALLIVGAVLSGGRFMLIGWIFFIVGLFLNALVLVVLVNRDQLTHLGAQLKRPDELELEIGEPVVQRLDEEVAESADMNAEPLPEDLPDGPEVVENGAKDTASVKRT